MPSKNEDLVVYGSGLIWDPPKINISKYIFECLKKHGKQVTLINADTGYQQTFDELRSLSVRTALEMQMRGITKNDVVAFYSKNYILSQLPFLATLYLGATSLPIHSTYSTNELKIILNKGCPKMIFCDDDYEIKIKNAIKELNLTNKVEIINLDKDFHIFMEPKNGENDFQVVDTDNVDTNIAVLVSTSGTFGLIKAVPLTHRSYFVSISTIYMEMNKTPYENTILTYAPLSWSSGFKLLTQSIILGLKRLIARPNPNNQIKLISDYKVNIIVSSATQITAMIKHPDFSKYNINSQIKQLLYGGSPSTVEQTKLFRSTFKNAWCFNGYGSTEMCGLHAFFHENDKLNIEKHNSSGKLLNETNGKIIDIDTGKILGRNELGEIVLKSPYMMTGYLKDPESTKDAIDSEGWYHTGDVGYFDDDNCLFCVDRLKETFKYFSLQVSPTEIESIIEKCPGVKSVCVVGKKDPICNNVPTAFIIKQDENLTESNVYHFTEDKLIDSQKLRGGIRFVTSFPMTSSGKVKRLELRKILDCE